MNNNKKRTHFIPWPRAIIFVDMNAFFASVEQYDFPELAGKPVAVTNGEIGTCIITCSYEARHCGIKTGMRLREARMLCPELIQRPSRPNRYAEVSSKIMAAFLELTDTIEIFSIDEAFLDVTASQSLFGSPIEMGKRTKQIVYEVCGLMCSVGVAADKTTAKYAASLHKPNGFYAVHPDDSESFLADAPLDALSGINKGVKRLTALSPTDNCEQLDLFYSQPETTKKVNEVVDKINDKYGEFTIAPAMLLKRSTMPNVISPSWKPSGHRRLV